MSRRSRPAGLTPSTRSTTPPLTTSTRRLSAHAGRERRCAMAPPRDDAARQARRPLRTSGHAEQTDRQPRRRPNANKIIHHVERLCAVSVTVVDLLATWAARRDDATSARLAT